MKATRFTPHELIFSHFRNLQIKLSESTELARTNLNQSKILSKYYYARKTNVWQFSPTGNVYSLREPKRSKFESEYTGPYRVLKILENNIKITYKRKPRVVQYNELKRALKVQARINRRPNSMVVACLIIKGWFPSVLTVDREMVRMCSPVEFES
ncbi:unnamed protein product [Heterotrigona itama]|uniref:Uncharacterized protein n=1 Tax=Heterotrigona itama TaxID=395501 RepID=A0A6V7HFS8_9HYME|nr:unnamed protein product [Heterotrigona itama]